MTPEQELRALEGQLSGLGEPPVLQRLRHLLDMPASDWALIALILRDDKQVVDVGFRRLGLRTETDPRHRREQIPYAVAFAPEGDMQRQWELWRLRVSRDGVQERMQRANKEMHEATRQWDALNEQIAALEAKAL